MMDPGCLPVTSPLGSWRRGTESSPLWHVHPGRSGSGTVQRCSRNVLACMLHSIATYPNVQPQPPDVPGGQSKGPPWRPTSSSVISVSPKVGERGEGANEEQLGDGLLRADDTPPGVDPDGEP